jgi:hypothetical protein
MQALENLIVCLLKEEMFINQNDTIVVLDQALYVANASGSNGSRSKPNSKD